MRRKTSILLKLLTVVFSFGGVILSFVGAEADGYSHWSKRLLYFTGLSNIAIGICMLLLLALAFGSASLRATRNIYILRYVFTVSITVTALIFCAVLAPFSHRDGYNAFTLSSLMTHVLAPSLAIADMFVDRVRVRILRRHTLISLIPLLAYLVFASALILMKVDFGRGDPYPYVFLNYYSPAGIFGFSNQMPYIFGSFYWMVLITLIVIGIERLYARLYNRSII